MKLSKKAIKYINEVSKIIHDNAEHIIGTEAEDHREIALRDAKLIRRMAKNIVKLTTSEK